MDGIVVVEETVEHEGPSSRLTRGEHYTNNNNNNNNNSRHLMESMNFAGAQKIKIGAISHQIEMNKTFDDKVSRTLHEEPDCVSVCLFLVH